MGFSSGKQQGEQAQRMHGPQRLAGMRLQQCFLQVEPEFCSPRRSHRQSRKLLFDSVLRSRTQFQPVVRHKVKQAQQHFRIAQRR